jgi:hypothetical protein
MKPAANTRSSRCEHKLGAKDQSLPPASVHPLRHFCIARLLTQTIQARVKSHPVDGLRMIVGGFAKRLARLAELPKRGVNDRHFK